MEKKIFKSMCMIAVMAIIIVAGMSTLMYYRGFEKRIMQDSVNITGLIKNSVETGSIDYLKNMDNHSDYRITYISENGSVLFDSEVEDTDIDSMSNHMDRPEVIDAVNSGEGRDNRVSSTLSVKTYYYAVRLSDRSVLRVAIDEKSEMAIFLTLVPELLIITVIMIISASIVANIQTRKIVNPINQINFDTTQDSEVVYDELFPFVEKIRNQKKVIEEQIQDIKSSKVEFEAITENMGEGLIVVDKNENVLSFNKSAMKILDIGERAERVRNFVAFSRNETLLRNLRQALSGERAENMLRTGEHVYQVVASPVIMDDYVNGAVLIIFDETEKELREDLRREFSANVSHELKTPLTSISGYAEIMKSGMVNDEDMVKFSGIIHSEAKRLINLVEDIIKISRLDDNEVELEHTDINLADIVDQNIKYLSAMAVSRQVEIIDNSKDGYVNGVRQILDEMVHNLIENAIKYNKEDGSVKVSVGTFTDASGAEKVSLIVEDTGIGIPEKDSQRVFERFYRVDKSHSKAIGGTGLGLSIVKHGAIFHNARIEMESHLGVGTKMKIVFEGIKKEVQL